MNWRINWRRNAQLVVVVLCAALVKLYYSTASVNQLRWILAPTTFLVEKTSGTRFEFELHAGYINSDRSFIIAASCAGVNFLITSFLMLSLSKLWRDRSHQGRGQKSEVSGQQLSDKTSNPAHKLRWRFIPLAALFAYLATLVANTVRISTALYLNRMPLKIGWLNPNQLHRFEGIFIYFGFLLLLFMVSEKIDSEYASALPTHAGPMGQLSSAGAAGPARRAHLRPAESVWVSQSATFGKRSCPPSGATSGLAKRTLGGDSGLLRQSFFPLLVYYATTLGIPMANGAYRQGSDFWEHSLFVLLTPLILILPLVTFNFFRYQWSVVSAHLNATTRALRR